MLMICLQGYSQKSKKQDKEDAQSTLLIKLDTVSHKYYYSDIVLAPDIPSTVLYSRAKDYLTKHYNFSVSKFIIEDSVEMHQRAKGSFGVTVVMSTIGIKIPTTTNIIYEMDVMFKDGRYKYNITNLNLSDQRVVPLEIYMKNSDNMNLGKGAQKKMETQLLEKIDENMIAEIKALKDALTHQKTKDNW